MASNLEKIDHIVVLMLGGASFDYLLGYLRLKQLLPVDGLRESNGPGVYLDESQVWAYDHLARTFAVCDRWFTSVPGPALPNWLFAVSGAAESAVRHDSWRGPDGGVVTVFDRLDRALHDRPGHERWGYYFQDSPTLGVLKQHVGELSPSLPRRVFNFLRGSTPRIRQVDEFFESSRLGSLPAVSWIDPGLSRLGGLEQERPPTADAVFGGQELVARVYQAVLEGGRDLWRRTLVVFTHGTAGGLDHVAPAATGDPAPLDRFGPRVPAIVVSAWTPPVVDGAERDHACIVRAILDRFAPAERLPPRLARAAPLDGLLSLQTARRDAGPIPRLDDRSTLRPRRSTPTEPARGGV